jgi:LacI family transcriptional regulator
MSSRRIPLVFLDTGTPQKGISNIAIDYASGIDAAVEHLTSLGHTAIGFISGPMDLTSARVRHKAFTNSMKRKGLKLDRNMIEEGNHRMDGGHEAMARLLDKAIRPTAVLASNDMTAIGAMGAIFERGLKVPQDISLIGFDDIELSAFTQPGLTTVRLSRQEIAKIAFRALYDVKENASAKGAEFTIQPTLIERKSTGPVAARRGTKHPLQG